MVEARGLKVPGPRVRSAALAAGTAAIEVLQPGFCLLGATLAALAQGLRFRSGVVIELDLLDHGALPGHQRVPLLALLLLCRLRPELLLKELLDLPIPCLSRAV